MAAVDLTKRIDATALMRIKSLELRARRILEGYTQGLHKSPYHGSSVEFSEYREYAEGDDPKHIDWKLYARSDRYCIKKYEAETNLICHIAVDQSRSMEFTSLDYTKVCSDVGRDLCSVSLFPRRHRRSRDLCR